MEIYVSDVDVPFGFFFTRQTGGVKIEHGVPFL
jgi:hypothetical protein